ncbi:MAG: glycosyltransferase family 2 protein [Nodosilinea sp.]
MLTAINASLDRITRKLTVALLRQSAEFDAAYYLKHNPDVAAANADPAWHYLLSGAAEGRRPNPTFDAEAYLTQHPDLSIATLDPFIHYLVTSGDSPGLYYSPQDPAEPAQRRVSTRVNSLNRRLMQSLIQRLWQLRAQTEALRWLGEGGLPRSPDPAYQAWLEENFPDRDAMRQRRQAAKHLAWQPTISIIMPTYNTPERFLREAVRSVLKQVYPHWELCIADDASTAPQVKAILNRLAQKDRRIKLLFRPQNGHISQASNSALTLATGEFIALLDHDDLLTPDALYEVAALVNTHPEADIIYSDEDKLDEQNFLTEPFFKPDWSPDSLLSRMYLSHLSVYRRQLVLDHGGFRSGFEGAQDYDLALRLTEQTQQIFHIPKILYHWRMHRRSTAAATGQKPYAHLAAQRAVEEALARRVEPGQFQLIDAGHGIVRYDLTAPERVSIIIPTRDLAETLAICLDSIFATTTYPDFEVVVVDNGSVEPQTFELFEQWRRQQPGRFSVYPLDIPFNYSKLNNYGAQMATGRYLLFLNNDTEVLTADWLTAMVEQAQRPSIGAVGALLLFPDDTVQHAGVVAGIGGVAGHSHKYFQASEPGYFNQLQTVNNYAAVTAACLMCRRDVFDAVGGFEETLQVAFNDIDFCFKLLEQGYYNVYLPHVRLYHYESKSRGAEDSIEKQTRFAQEIARMTQRWGDIIERDPFYNPNLTLTTEDYALRRSPTPR